MISYASEKLDIWEKSKQKKNHKWGSLVRKEHILVKKMSIS